MKSKIMIIALAGSICLLSACGGDHNPKAGQVPDNKYNAKDSSQGDTGKITSGDHSASGGSDLVKDSSKQATK